MCNFTLPFQGEFVYYATVFPGRCPGLIWNDLCQVPELIFFDFLHIFFMTLPGAGGFDDESV